MIEVNVTVNEKVACREGLPDFGCSVVRPTDEQWLSLSSEDRERLVHYIGTPNKLEVCAFVWDAVLAELPVIRRREQTTREIAENLRKLGEARRRENMAQIAQRILSTPTWEELSCWTIDFAQYGRDVVAHVEHLKQTARNKVQQALSEADAAEGLFCMTTLRRHPEIGRHPWFQSYAVCSSDAEVWEKMIECSEGHPQIVALLKSIRTAHERHVQRTKEENEARQAEHDRQIAEVREWAKSIAPAAVEAGYSVAQEIAKEMSRAAHEHYINGDAAHGVDNREPLSDRRVTDAREEWVLGEQKIRQGFAELLSKLPPHSTVQLWDDEDGKRALRRRTFDSFGMGDDYAARIGVCVLLDCPPAGEAAHVELFVVLAGDDAEIEDGEGDENDDD